MVLHNGDLYKSHKSRVEVENSIFSLFITHQYSMIDFITAIDSDPNSNQSAEFHGKNKCCPLKANVENLFTATFHPPVKFLKTVTN